MSTSTNTTDDNREVWRKKAEARMQAVEAEIAQVQARIKESTADAQGKQQELLDKLRGWKEDLGRQAHEVAQAGEGTWEAVADRAEQTWDKMKDTVQQHRS